MKDPSGSCREPTTANSRAAKRRKDTKVRTMRKVNAAVKQRLIFVRVLQTQGGNSTHHHTSRAHTGPHAGWNSGRIAFKRTATDSVYVHPVQCVIHNQNLKRTQGIEDVRILVHMSPKAACQPHTRHDKRATQEQAHDHGHASVTRNNTTASRPDRMRRTPHHTKVSAIRNQERMFSIEAPREMHRHAAHQETRHSRVPSSSR